MQGQPPIQTFTESLCQKYICLTGNQWCALLTFPQWQCAKPTCHWLLMSPSAPSRPLWMCLLLQSGRQVLAGQGKVLKCFCSFNESRCPHSAFTCTYKHNHTRMCTKGNWCLGSLCTTLLSVVCYQLKTGREKYLVGCALKHIKSRALFLGLASTFMDEVDGWWTYYTVRSGCIIKNGDWSVSGCTRTLYIGNV